MSNREILTALSPCSDGLARAAESHTLREWWETSTTRSDMLWLVGKVHSKGSLSRRRLVHVAVRCAETVAHLIPPAALPLLADLSAWTHGADDVDLTATRNALLNVRHAAYAAAYAAAAAADAAAADAAYDAACAAYAAADAAYDAACAAYAAAYAADAAYDAAYAAAYAAYAAAYAADAAVADFCAAITDDAAMCDVIRDAIGIDEVCAALGLDPDQGVV